MRKTLVWALALVLSLLGLMTDMPVLTQSPSSAQVDVQDAGPLNGRTRNGGTWTNPDNHMRGESTSDGEARGYELGAQSCYGSSDTDVHFPSANTWINSPITIGCAPPGATVTSVDVMVNIVHDCPQATKVELRYGGRTLVLWNREGTCGGVSYFAPSKNDVTVFNGLPANGTWQAYAVDEVGYGSQYYIDHWNITVEYGSTGPTATPTATPGPTSTPTTPTTTPTVGPSPTLKPPLEPTCRNTLSNGDFESGDLWPWEPWESAGLGPGRTSNHGGWIGGVTDSNSDLHRWVTIPSVLTPVTLRFWWVAEVDTPQSGDRLTVYLERGDDLDLLVDIPATGPLAQWVQAEADLSTYADVAISWTCL